MIKPKPFSAGAAFAFNLNLFFNFILLGTHAMC